MGDGVKGLMHRILQGGAGLVLSEEEATTRISDQEDPVVRGLAVEGGGLH